MSWSGKEPCRKGETSSQSEGEACTISCKFLICFKTFGLIFMLVWTMKRFWFSADCYWRCSYWNQGQWWHPWERVLWYKASFPKSLPRKPLPIRHTEASKTLFHDDSLSSPQPNRPCISNGVRHLPARAWTCSRLALRGLSWLWSLQWLLLKGHQPSTQPH